MNTVRILTLIQFSLLFIAAGATGADWLLDPSPFKAQVERSADGREVVLENGLVRRVIRLEPNAATITFDNLMTGESIIRAVRPERPLAGPVVEIAILMALRADGNIQTLGVCSGMLAAGPVAVFALDVG